VAVNKNPDTQIAFDLVSLHVRLLLPAGLPSSRCVLCTDSWGRGLGQALFIHMLASCQAR
jgi:hypothetical protein